MGSLVLPGAPGPDWGAGGENSSEDFGELSLFIKPGGLATAHPRALSVRARVLCGNMNRLQGHEAWDLLLLLQAAPLRPRSFGQQP